MDMSEKIRRKTLAQDVFDRRWCLDGDKNTGQKYISARSSTLSICAMEWALCGRPQPEHESMMPLLSLSPLNV